MCWRRSFQFLALFFLLTSHLRKLLVRRSAQPLLAVQCCSFSSASQSSFAGSACLGGAECSALIVNENHPRRKNFQKKHLSPSRRRASRLFFVQTPREFNRTRRPGGAWGAASDRRFHRVQIFEGMCNAVAQGGTARSGRGNAGVPGFNE